MGYTKAIYNKCFNILSQRRQNAIDTSLRNRSKVYRDIPRLMIIENELKAIGVTLSRNLLSGSEIDELIGKYMKSSLALQAEREVILKENGFPADYLQVKYTCPKCEDTGANGTSRCDCLKELLRQEAYASLNAVSSLEGFGFNKFKLTYYGEKPVDETNIIPRKRMSDIFGFCIEYAENFSKNSRSLLFLGKTGLGKTHLSLSIASIVIDKGYGAVYTSVPRLINKISRGQFNNDDGEDYMSYVLEADLLILDDLGAEHASQYNISIIYNIINTRMLECRPVIISANLDVDEIHSRYSERIASRLLCEYKSMLFVGEDIREKKRSVTDSARSLQASK